MNRPRIVVTRRAVLPAKAAASLAAAGPNAAGQVRGIAEQYFA
jgi:hypothetical protein